MMKRNEMSKSQEKDEKPGPGQYTPTIGGFDQMEKNMKTMNELRTHGLEKLSNQVMQKSANFKSGQERFDDTNLFYKA